MVAGVVLAQPLVSGDTCPPAPMPFEQQMAYVATSTARNAGFLWRIEKDGRASWLYGTMHLNHIDYAKPGPQIMMGMQSSDTLMLEINPYEPLTPSAPIQVPVIKLSSEQLERISKAYARECLTLNTAKVGTLPLFQTQAQRQGLFGGYSPDIRLAQIAKRTGKTIAQLETPEQQMALMTPKSQSEFDTALQADLNEFESGKMQSNIAQLHKAWKEGAWQTFVNLEQDITSSKPEFAQLFLDQRNIQMAQKIDLLHQEGKRVFVAVGALHMAGNAALPKLMQDKGYRVSSVLLRN